MSMLLGIGSEGVESMSDTVVVALISGLVSLLGIVITSAVTIRSVAKKFEVKMEVAMAVQNTNITELTREVREHNGFAVRIPLLENEIKHLKDEINALKNHNNLGGISNEH